MKKPYKFVGWKYPCDVSMFFWRDFECGRELDFDMTYTIIKSKKGLKEVASQCGCGENCKPVKVRITEEIINE
jgi:hypothetical protein